MSQQQKASQQQRQQQQQQPFTPPQQETGTPAEQPGEQRSGEGSQSALARLRSQERSKALGSGTASRRPRA